MNTEQLLEKLSDIEDVVVTTVEDVIIKGNTPDTHKEAFVNLIKLRELTTELINDLNNSKE